ncbi:unnamed protein product [Trichobilharzia szidati]|nr:unnamed protein product [Trichobilharzia szidati]
MCYYQQQINNMTNTCNQVHFENKCWSPTYPNIISTAFTNASTTANTTTTNTNTESKNLHQNKEFVVTGECDEGRRDGGDDKSDDENLPGYIISCLTKVCSGLLVNAYPDANSCEEFLQILEMILSHVAFSEQQKKLVLFWKHRVLVVYGQYLNHHSHAYSSKSKSDSSNYYNYCPRSVSQVHYFDNRFRKYPTHYTSQEQQRTGSNHLGYKTFQTNSLSPSNVCFHNIQDTSSRLTMDSLEVPPQSIVDASSIHSNTSLNIPVTAEMSRRHSVSVGDPQNHLIVGKSINRRRMPSPNSPCFSGRTGVPGNLNSLNLGYTNHPQASSDMELSGYPSQLPKPRFHSPSRFDPSINITPRRNLIPLATAPVTRMPSPSDVCRNNNQCSDWLSPNNRFAFPMAPFTSNISPLSTCEGSCSDNMNPDSHLLQQLQTPNVPICMLSLQNAYQNTYGSCSCLPPTKTNTHHQTLMLNSPNHPKATTLQTNQPTFDGNSRRNFLSTLNNNNYSSIPCIPNSVVTNTSNNTIHPPTPISSYKSTSFGNNNSLNSSCSAADKSTQSYASSSSVPQEVNNNIPTVGGGGCYWSNNNFSSNQASRNQISSVHEIQCLHHLYDSNNDNDNNNHNHSRNNNKDLLVFVDNYIATAENNMIGGDSSDASNDRINRDLDLLTREVTEHAIGASTQHHSHLSPYTLIKNVRVYDVTNLS